MTSPAQDLLEIRGVEKTLGSGAAAVQALRGVSFSVRAGELVAVMGPSGSGKSTLLALAGGLDRPDRGSVLLDGVDLGAQSLRVVAAARRRSIGFVFQELNLVQGLTAAENVSLPLELDGRSGRSARSRAIEALEAVGIADLADRFPDDMSGGQQQRVAIARALALDPKVMLFDEPTSALDPELVGEVLSVIRSVAESGMTMVVVTHELGFAREVGDQCVFMEDGVVVEAGGRDLFTNSSNPRTRRFVDAVL
jgi:putative ABC transport system ATP-binding protein